MGTIGAMVQQPERLPTHYMEHSKLTVAHLCKAYLSPTHTFIYSYLTASGRFTPVVISLNSFQNTNVFPFPQDRLHTVGGHWLYRHWLKGTGASRSAMRLLNVRFARLVKRAKPALLHAHFGDIGYYAAAFRQTLGVPLVTSFYGYDMAPEGITVPGLYGGLRSYPSWPAMRRVVFEQSDMILAEGPFMAQSLISHGCAEEKIRIQPLAIDPSSISYRGEARQHTRPVLLFVGRLVEKKGCIYGLEAARLLKAQGCDFEFRIVGDGNLRAPLERFVRDNELTGNVSFLGYRTNEQCLAEMSRADIFIHPSITADDGNTEGGAPTAILEAQAAGLPIVSTVHADIPNVVDVGKSAVLSPERDSASLSRTIRELLEDPERRLKMGEVGRRFVERHHGIERLAGLLQDRYSALTGGAR